MARGTEGPHHLIDTLTHSVFPNLVVGPHQLQRLALDQGILLFLERRGGVAEPALSAAARHRPAIQRVRGHLLEEIRYRYIQHLAELEQPTRADAVEPPLVLLDLLECQSDRIAEHCLTHSEQRSSLPQTIADMDVDRM